jgi:hypothetical protein
MESLDKEQSIDTACCIERAAFGKPWLQNTPWPDSVIKGALVLQMEAMFCPKSSDNPYRKSWPEIAVIGSTGRRKIWPESYIIRSSGQKMLLGKPW